MKQKQNLEKWNNAIVKIALPRDNLFNDNFKKNYTSDKDVSIKRSI